MKYGHYVGILVLLLISLAVFGDVWSITHAQESAPTIINQDCPHEYFTIPGAKSIEDCKDIIGYGVAYGPRESRQEIIVWDCCGTFRLRVTQYNEPESNLHTYGSIESRVETVLPGEVYDFLLDQLQDPDTCVEVFK